MSEATCRVDALAAIVGGTLTTGGDRVVRRVVIDSREEVRGALFVALEGERFDGHDFVAEVEKKGAAAVMVSRRLDDLAIPQIVVANTLDALTALAAHHRSSYPGTVAAVTGSSGKTTTRTLIASILSVRHRVHQPVRNFNNHIGVPLTLLGLGPSADVAVFELGCSNFGEIAHLTKLVQPHVAVVTNVGPAHLENLGDLAGVARAKGEMFSHMPGGGVAVVNLDDVHVSAMSTGTARRLTFSTRSSADVQLLCRRPVENGQILTIALPDGSIELLCPLPGEHNAVDATAAAAVAVAMGETGADIAAGLSTVRPVNGRLNVLSCRGMTIIDDTYNANPSSMAAAFDVLKEMAAPGHAVAAIGDMLELGEESAAAHRYIGTLAARAGVRAVVVKGNWKDHTLAGALEAGLPPSNGFAAVDSDEMVKILTEISKTGDALLIKGSRGMRMEEVVAGIREGK
jgi:UDP-N-acetylmuramoyl-tripeptide--D-alanyl-D-alanine ligase